MGVIIGAATTVSFGGGHVTQVSWGINVNVQRAYVLGSWEPYTAAEIKSPTETLNLTVYSPGPVRYSTTPSTTCEFANQVNAEVDPAGCGDAFGGPVSENWYVNSYSYSKGDAVAPGQESWSLIQYVTAGHTDVVLPTYVLRGISEGTITSTESLSVAEGITGTDMSGTVAGEEVTRGLTGSVSAGQIGRSDYQYSGVITAVGQSAGASGDIANASCSMPYTPLYI